MQCQRRAGVAVGQHQHRKAAHGNFGVFASLNRVTLKQRGVLAEHIPRLIDILTLFDTANSVEDMRLASLQLHGLKGEQKGTWAVTVRANWRLTFRFQDNHAFEVDLLDYH